jgi:hypothetical protein
MGKTKGEMLLAGLLAGLALWAGLYAHVTPPALAQTTGTPNGPVMVTSARTVSFPTPMIAVTGYRLQLDLDTATPTPTATGPIYMVVTRGSVYYITPRSYNPKLPNLATLIYAKPLHILPTNTPFLVTLIPLPSPPLQTPKLPKLGTLIREKPRLYLPTNTAIPLPSLPAYLPKSAPLHYFLGTPTLTPPGVR